MKDEEIEKLINSNIYEDMLIGRILLLRKYPEILKNAEGHYSGDQSVYHVKAELVKKYCSIDITLNTSAAGIITGFVIAKDNFNERENN